MVFTVQAKKQMKRRRKKSRQGGIAILWLIGIWFLLGLGFLRWTGGQDVGRTEASRKEMNRNADGLPQSLAKLAERNPETIGFVENYPNYRGRQEKIDLSGEVTAGSIPFFLQWDERWGYELYGNDFMAVTGCGPTCISMVYTGLTGDTSRNPLNVAELAEKEGYYVEGSGSSWTMMEELPKELGLQVETVVYDEEHIRRKLEEGHPIICIMGPGDFTQSGHFIVLCGVDEDGKIILHDPNSIQNTNKAWELSDFIRQIRNLWAYSYENQR